MLQDFRVGLRLLGPLDFRHVVGRPPHPDRFAGVIRDDLTLGVQDSRAAIRPHQAVVEVERLLIVVRRLDDRIHPLDQVRGIEEISLARTRSTAALRDTADRAVTVREDDGAAG